MGGKQSKKAKEGFRAFMPLVHTRTNRVPKYIIYNYIILILLPILVNSAL